MAAPSEAPKTLRPNPCQPPVRPETVSPANRKGSTSQFGIRRVRRSLTVATLTANKVGHQAIECIYVVGAHKPETRPNAIEKPFLYVAQAPYLSRFSSRPA